MPKVVRFHEMGGADVLRIEDLPVEEPGENEVRVNMQAIGLNRAEVALRAGQYTSQPELPSRIGYEGAGIVDAVGPGVTHVKAGDNVSIIPAFPMGKYGVYGESIVVPGYAVAHHPDKLSPVEAASIWMQYLTAYGAIIHDGHLQAGQTLVVTAASSSAGIAAIQIGKYVGATVIATTRGADKKDFLLEVGADHVIVSDEEDIAERTMAITRGQGAEILFDPVAGPFLQKMAEAAAFGATIYEYGAFHAETMFPLFTAIAKGLNIHTYTLYELTRIPEALEAGKEFVIDGIEAGKLWPIIDSEFPLNKIVDAHRYMESNKQRGKIVVTV